MTKEQKVVAIAATSGALAMAIAVATISRLWPVNADLIDVTSRLAYALQMNAVAILPLLVGIMIVGNNRFLSDAIDPTGELKIVAQRPEQRRVGWRVDMNRLLVYGKCNHRILLSHSYGAPNTNPSMQKDDTHGDGRLTRSNSDHRIISHKKVTQSKKKRPCYIAVPVF